jgi:hypothetical protein
MYMYNGPKLHKSLHTRMPVTRRFFDDLRPFNEFAKNVKGTLTKTSISCAERKHTTNPIGIISIH